MHLASFHETVSNTISQNFQWPNQPLLLSAHDPRQQAVSQLEKQG